MSTTPLKSARIPDVDSLTIQQIRAGLEARQFKVVDLVTAYSARIHEVNDRCRAVISLHMDAMSEARDRDHDYELGRHRGHLHGVPILIKDVFNTNDSLDTTVGSFALKEARLGVEATVVKRLRAAGAIILGTANLSQWANFRSSDVPPGWSAVGGQCLGPYAERQNPTGSSSGSAVAARLGLAAACIGTENNGSITIPASKACCVGFKPTVGLVSRHGAWPANFYQDCPGTLTRCVEDSGIIVQVISGRDSNDPLTQTIPDTFDPADMNVHDGPLLNGVRFAVPRHRVKESVEDPDILDQFEETLHCLRHHGATIVDDVDYPTWTPKFSNETLSFVWAQLGNCFTGYMNSLKSNPAEVRSIDDLISFMGDCKEERYPEFGASRFEQANTSPPMDFEAEFARRLAKGSEIALVLEQHQCDALIMPIGCKNPADLGQCPVMCLPMGFYPPTRQLEVDKFNMAVTGSGIPFGLLMIGKKWSDTRLCQVASAYEKVIRARIGDMDKPMFMPTTELRDVVQARLRTESGRFCAIL